MYVKWLSSIKELLNLYLTTLNVGRSVEGTSLERIEKVTYFTPKASRILWNTYRRPSALNVVCFDKKQGVDDTHFIISQYNQISWKKRRLDDHVLESSLQAHSIHTTLAYHDILEIVGCLKRYECCFSMLFDEHSLWQQKSYKRFEQDRCTPRSRERIDGTP